LPRILRFKILDSGFRLRRPRNDGYTFDSV
jgi:hypothetical protein